MNHLLAIDLGGTKSRIGLYDLGSGEKKPVAQAVYKNTNFASIEEVLSRFFIEHSCSAQFACLAVAGVIEGDSVTMTNLSWKVEGASLKRQFGFAEVFLLNDLAALAASVPLLSKSDIFTIHHGQRLQGETIGVIAPGTGLGQGYLVSGSEGYLAKGCEGGHSSFAATNEEELEILRWMLQKHEVVSVEQICSGPGIGELYHYFVQQGKIQQLEEVRQQVAGADDITPLVVSHAVSDNPCPLCAKVVDTYLYALGSETANLALKLYTRGGVYIGGGILLHLHGKISFAPFLKGFLRDGKMSELLASIPVFGIRRGDAQLLGIVDYAVQRLEQRDRS